MITWADVVLMDSGLSAVPVGTQTAILDDVYLQLPAIRWGAKLDLGAKYLALHMGTLVLRGGSGATGAVISERLGDAARTYASANINLRNPSDLDATIWGTFFRRLAKSLAFGGVSGLDNNPLNISPGPYPPWRP